MGTKEEVENEYSKVIPPELQQILIDEDILIDAVREQNEHKVKLILDTFKQYNRNKELNDFLQNTNYWGDVLENSHKNESIFNHLMDVFESDEESKICAKNLVLTKVSYNITVLGVFIQFGTKNMIERILQLFNSDDQEILIQSLQLKDMWGGTFLSHTSKNESEGNEILKLIFKYIHKEKKEEILKLTSGGEMNIFHNIASRGSIEMFNTILEQFDEEESVRDLLQSRNELGNTPLHFASNSPNAEDIFLKILDLNQKLSKNEKETQNYILVENTDAQNILHVAAQYGNLKMIKSIIEIFEKKDDVLLKKILMSKNNAKKTPLHLMIQNKQVAEIEEYLFEKIEQITDEEEMKDFLQMKTKFDYTIFHLAAAFGRENLIKKFFEKFNLENEQEKNLLKEILQQKIEGESIFDLAQDKQMSDLLDMQIQKLC